MAALDPALMITWSMVNPAAAVTVVCVESGYVMKTSPQLSHGEGGPAWKARSVAKVLLRVS